MTLAPSFTSYMSSHILISLMVIILVAFIIFILLPFVLISLICINCLHNCVHYVTLSPLSFCRVDNDCSLFRRGLEILMPTVMTELCNDATLKTPTLISRWLSFLPFLKQDESHDWQEARVGDMSQRKAVFFYKCRAKSE